jgi:EAL domain-containing protein (putative c-di-GMP-specific phosphodiesterase class I)
MAQRRGDYDLDSSMVVCEITEQAAPDDAVLVAVVREMRRNGFRIAIDDFGTGHSTEARVRMLEPDIVKIDGGWFAELCRHAAAERLFRPLLCLLHDQGAKVLVEGIEEPRHLDVALEAGADLLQGFLLARPALTGTLLDAGPLAVDRLLRPAAKIIPLFG